MISLRNVRLMRNGRRVQIFCAFIRNRKHEGKLIEELRTRKFHQIEIQVKTSLIIREQTSRRQMFTLLIILFV